MPASGSNVTKPRKRLDPEVFEFVGMLPSIVTPDRTASPLRRARKLAGLYCVSVRRRFSTAFFRSRLGHGSRS